MSAYFSIKSKKEGLMYSTYGIEHSIQNIFKLSAPFMEKETISKIKDLKPAYLRFLKSIHPNYPIVLNNDLIIRSKTDQKIFQKAFSESKLNDLDQEKMVGDHYDLNFFEANAKLINYSIQQLSIINPELGELFDLCIHGILLCDSLRNQDGKRALGGTSSDCIGLIWLNIKPDMSPFDVIEILVHELTHTLIFLDELVYGHFDYKHLAKKDFWARSAILKKQRPMDKVLHSMIVSLEILLARKNYLENIDTRGFFHPPSEELISALNLTLKSISDHPNLNPVLKPRSVELLKNVSFQLKEIEENVSV